MFAGFIINLRFTNGWMKTVALQTKSDRVKGKG